jgi:hypothetical protein
MVELYIVLFYYFIIISQYCANVRIIITSDMNDANRIEQSIIHNSNIYSINLPRGSMISLMMKRAYCTSGWVYS